MVLMKLSDAYLDTEHEDAFTKAINTILLLPLTEITMAQLVDGLPLESVAWESLGNHMRHGHPLQEHDRLCDGVLEKTLSFRKSFSADNLSFESHLLRGFADTTPGSKDFKMRLVEMAAVSVHQIAAELFNMSPKSHTPDYIKYVTEWQPPSGWDDFCGRQIWKEPLFAPPETHFFHGSYTDSDLYPRGVADMAGYWAEDRILGGVVVFDRGESGTECKDIFFHPGREGQTMRIWCLLDTQLDLLTDYLLTGIPREGFSLPLFATSQNRYRFDRWDAMAYYRIFRDPWERRIQLDPPEEKDVRCASDYPEIDAMFDAVEEADETGRSMIREAPRRSYPPPADRMWIYKIGGHMGYPLRSQHLPQKGPPRSRKSPSVPEDRSSGDGDSVSSDEESYQDNPYTENPYKAWFRDHPDPDISGAGWVWEDGAQPREEAKSTAQQPEDEKGDEGDNLVGGSPTSYYHAGDGELDLNAGKQGESAETVGVSDGPGLSRKRKSEDELGPR